MKQTQAKLIEAIGYAQQLIEEGAEITSAGGTFTGHIHVPNQAYGPLWDGSTRVPTMNAIYDKIETLAPAAGGVFVLDDGDSTGSGTGFLLDDGGS